MCDTGTLSDATSTPGSGNASPVNLFEDVGNQFTGTAGSEFMDNLTTTAVNTGIGYATDGLVNIDTVDTLAGTKEHPNYWNTAGNSLKGYLASTYLSGGGGDGGGDGGYSAGSEETALAGNSSVGYGDPSTGYDTLAGNAAIDTGSSGSSGVGMWGSDSGGGLSSSNLPSSSPNTATPPAQTDTAKSWLDSLAGGAKKYGSTAQGVYQLMNAYQQQKAAKKAQAQSGAERAPYVAQMQALTADPSGYLSKTPGYQSGLDAVQRSMAAQGFQGSGNMMAALQKYGGDSYMQQMQLLSNLAGRPYDSNAALTQSNAYANSLMNSGFYNLGRGVSGS